MAGQIYIELCMQESEQNAMWTCSLLQFSWLILYTTQLSLCATRARVGTMTSVYGLLHLTANQANQAVTQQALIECHRDS